jgi:hypothetical protein
VLPITRALGRRTTITSKKMSVSISLSCIILST